MSEKLMRELETVCLSRCSRAKSGSDWAAFVKPSAIVEAVKRLREEKYHLEDVTAVDAKEGFVVVYHFDRFSNPERITLRVLVPHDSPKVPTISSVYQGANWHERETHDFYGVEFVGHPYMLPLLLPEDADFHPLVKDDASRAPVRTVIDSGEIVSKASSFTLFEEPAEESKEEAPAEA